MRRRFFVDQVRNGHAEIHGEDAKHLTRVLRVEAGQRLSVDAVDLAPFRASADRVYAESDLAKAWDTAGLQRVLKA